jgi:hypothetical protein
MNDTRPVRTPRAARASLRLAQVSEPALEQGLDLHKITAARMTGSEFRRGLRQRGHGSRAVGVGFVRTGARCLRGQALADRLVDWRDSCWRCRRPIVPGQLWTVVSNGEAVARFHQSCHGEWLGQQEALARRAMGLDRSERP